jgi:hypothetical protein
MRQSGTEVAADISNVFHVLKRRNMIFFLCNFHSLSDCNFIKRDLNCEYVWNYVTFERHNGIQTQEAKVTCVCIVT